VATLRTAIHLLLELSRNLVKMYRSSDSDKCDQLFTLNSNSGCVCHRCRVDVMGCLHDAIVGAARPVARLFSIKLRCLDLLWICCTACRTTNPQQIEVIAIGWLVSRVVSVLDSGAEGPGFKSQSRRCRVTFLGKLFTPIVPLFTKQQNWQQPS